MRSAATLKNALVILQDVLDVIGVTEQIETADAERQSDDVAVCSLGREKEAERVPPRLRERPQEGIAARTRDSLETHERPDIFLVEDAGRVTRRRRPPFPFASGGRWHRPRL
jgi:hypothetical protein